MPSRLLTLLLAVALASVSARGEDDLRHRFGVIDIQPGKTSIFIGNVTLTMPPFVLKGGVLRSTYAATVFPYFFFSESGTISIDIPDETLHRAARGEKISFVGQGMSDAGESRRVEGTAQPIDGTHGRIRVRIYVSKRISLAFDTSYRLPQSHPPAP